MLQFTACHPEHVRLLRVQIEQQADWDFVIGNGGEENVLAGMNFSAWLDNRCVAVGGVRALWPGHGTAWCMLSPAVAPEMTRLTRFSRGLFDVQPYRRLSTSVACHFAPAHRWVRMLGFTMESERMVAYHPSGHDCALYARVRQG